MRGIVPGEPARGKAGGEGGRFGECRAPEAAGPREIAGEAGGSEVGDEGFEPTGALPGVDAGTGGREETPVGRTK